MTLTISGRNKYLVPKPKAMWLKLADILLTLIHLAVIGFNLLVWVWLFTRRLHLIVAGITAGCWFILGIWFGIGYCPVTNLQWHVKEKAGRS
jgi:hypothetical protein